jgi:hypothetical protein
VYGRGPVHNERSGQPSSLTLDGSTQPAGASCFESEVTAVCFRHVTLPISATLESLTLVGSRRSPGPVRQIIRNPIMGRDWTLELEKPQRSDRRVLVHVTKLPGCEGITGGSPSRRGDISVC